MKQTFVMLVVALLFSTAIAASPLLNNISCNTAEVPTRNELIITPVFKSGAAKISFKSLKAAKGTVVVLNEQGKAVLQQEATIEAGQNTLVVNNFTSLADGTYKVCVKAGKKLYTSTYILWK